MNLVLCIRRGEAVSVVTYNTEVAIVQSDRGDLPLCVCVYHVHARHMCQTHDSAAPIL